MGGQKRPPIEFETDSTSPERCCKLLETLLPAVFAHLGSFRLVLECIHLLTLIADIS
jgi:hypothetical protein